MSPGWVGKLLGILFAKTRQVSQTWGAHVLVLTKMVETLPAKLAYRFKLFKLINWEEIFEEGGKLKWRWLGERESRKLFFLIYDFKYGVALWWKMMILAPCDTRIPFVHIGEVGCDWHQFVKVKVLCVIGYSNLWKKQWKFTSV